MNDLFDNILKVPWDYIQGIDGEQWGPIGMVLLCGFIIGVTVMVLVHAIWGNPMSDKNIKKRRLDYVNMVATDCIMNALGAAVNDGYLTEEEKKELFFRIGDHAGLRDLVPGRLASALLKERIKRSVSELADARPLPIPEPPANVKPDPMAMGLALPKPMDLTERFRNLNQPARRD